MGTTVKKRVMAAVLAVPSFIVSDARGQVVRVAPVVRQTATPEGSTRVAGATPPASAVRVAARSTFYVEIWATQPGAPPDGLACVYVDLGYDRTDLMDSSPPLQASGLFSINVVTPVFDDPSGAVGDIGGCQPIPAIAGLGVGEWVLVDRVPMTAIGTGSNITVSVSDANNVFAGTSIIGQLNNVPPATIDFQTRLFAIGDCLTASDCDDNDVCTHDACTAGLCGNPSRLYGDVNNDGNIDIFDVLCALDGFAGVFSVCAMPNVDLAPCPGGDGLIDIFDILAVLDGFAGVNGCGCPAGP
ncbi:MAG: hypothetical protein HOP29_16055 [Phycisphaerales bacterium]|nr:hypothetical protein [Phycisphaerales bacterium]